MRRTLSLILLLLFASLLTVAHAQTKSAAKPAKKSRILMQWAEGDSMGQWLMTKHVDNLLADLGRDKVELEVLAYGPATFAVSSTRPQAKFAADIAKFSAEGVKFRVCHHAMDLLGVTDAELQPNVTPVQGAMSHIAIRHNEGWQILRP